MWRRRNANHRQILSFLAQLVEKHGVAGGRETGSVAMGAAASTGNGHELLEAAEHGHIDGLAPVLTKGAALKATDSDGNTALLKAAGAGHLDVVGKLIKKGATLDAKNHFGYTALMKAAGGGHADVVAKLLAEGTELEAKDNFGDTALILASRRGHVDVMTLLLDKGALLQARDVAGDTALIEAARRNLKDVVALLLEKSAALEAKDSSGQTSLILASRRGHAGVVSLLVEKGAALGAADNAGQTALMKAVGGGHMDVVTLLLEKGAALDAKDNLGDTARTVAAKYGHADVLALLQELRVQEDSAAADEAALRSIIGDDRPISALSAGDWMQAEKRAADAWAKASADAQRAAALLQETERDATPTIDRADTKASTAELALADALHVVVGEERSAVEAALRPTVAKARAEADAARWQGAVTVAEAAEAKEAAEAAEGAAKHRHDVVKAKAVQAEKKRRSREEAREKARLAGNLLHVQMFDVADRLGGSLSNLRSPDGTAPRFEATDLIFGLPQQAAKGIEGYLCVAKNDLLLGQVKGMRGVIEEVRANGSDDDKECLDYVLNQEAGSSLLTFQGGLRRDCDELGRVLPSRVAANGRGMRLADFVAHDYARAADLSELEVVCLRYYTTNAFQSINVQLRDQARYEAVKPHPLPLTVVTIKAALDKLRVIESEGPRANDMLPLYRGLAGRQVPDSFLQGGRGGTELAPMSSTTSLKVAMQYAASEKALLLRILSENFMVRGPQIAFLSAFPGEEEFLFPPLTYLQPVGDPQELRVDDATFTVIDVKPQM